VPPVDAATLAKAARRGPITVTAEGKPAFVVVSPGEFERLARRAAKYDEAHDPVMVAVRAMQRTAAARGLTEEELETATAGRADCIVTGDQDLLVLDPFGNIRILTPAAFVVATAAENGR
jgi:prevent-host-death family protein